MRVNMMKRYCYKQSHYGGLGEALSALAEVQDRHPGEDIRLEYNERSHSTKYRIVRIVVAEVEVPDAPDKAEFDLPERPKAVALPDDQVVEEILTERGSWGPTRMLTLKHTSSGKSVERRMYSDATSWDRKYLRESLEEKLDPTYTQRAEQFRHALNVYQAAIRVWHKECEEAFDGVPTTA